jgi:hypothetical protein
LFIFSKSDFLTEEFNNLSDHENLKAENEFLKMKLMLENGAQFGKANDDSQVSPRMENEFLNYIAEFERQSQNPKYITVYDRIKKPTHFKPVAEIADDDIETAWEELSEYLGKYRIYLDACSPNISTRELYRFATEELFKQEMSDMNIPGMNTNFIYDEFYPDPIYDNSRMVQQDLFGDVFRKDDLFYKIHYPETGFAFNDKLFDSRQPYIDMINRFKSAFDEIELNECLVENCVVENDVCKIAGNYSASAVSGNDKTLFQGNYSVELEIGEFGYWDFKKIIIEGFNPQ